MYCLRCTGEWWERPRSDQWSRLDRRPRLPSKKRSTTVAVACCWPGGTSPKRGLYLKMGVRGLEREGKGFSGGMCELVVVLAIWIIPKVG